MCGGDGLADIVGRRLGNGNKLFFNKNKSLAAGPYIHQSTLLLNLSRFVTETQLKPYPTNATKSA